MIVAIPIFSIYFSYYNCMKKVDLPLHFSISHPPHAPINLCIHDKSVDCEMFQMNNNLSNWEHQRCFYYCVHHTNNNKTLILYIFQKYFLSFVFFTFLCLHTAFKWCDNGYFALDTHIHATKQINWAGSMKWCSKKYINNFNL